MRLIKLSGLIPDILKSEALEMLIENAKDFFRAGGILTFGDWAELNSNERLAMVIAQKLIHLDIEENILLERMVDKTIKTLKI